MTDDPAGTLYVVATPLGHLGDVSLRATEVLRAVSLVAAEDTRRTRKLLHHIGANTRTVAYHAHSSDKTLASLIGKLEAGHDIAIVTDAGTPGISDPGAALVAGAASRDVPVVPVPGPSAVATALSVSGFSANHYLFLGFLPRKGRERQACLEEAGGSRRTVVLFESPERVAATLRELARAGGEDRPAVVARELTKRFEEIRRGTLGELAGYYKESAIRGEVTLVVAGRADEPPPTPDAADIESRARSLLAEGVTKRDAARIIAKELGCSRNLVYRIVSTLSPSR